MFVGFIPVGVNDKLFYKMTWGSTHLISISKGLPSHCWIWESTKDDYTEEGSYRERTTAGRDVVPSSGWEARALLPAFSCPWSSDSALFWHSEQHSGPTLSYLAEKKARKPLPLLSAFPTQHFPTCSMGTEPYRKSLYVNNYPWHTHPLHSEPQYIWTDLNSLPVKMHKEAQPCTLQESLPRRYYLDHLTDYYPTSRSWLILVCFHFFFLGKQGEGWIFPFQSWAVERGGEWRTWRTCPKLPAWRWQGERSEHLQGLAEISRSMPFAIVIAPDNCIWQYLK